MPTSEKKSHSLRFTTELWEAAKEVAWRRRESVNGAAERMLTNYVRENAPELLPGEAAADGTEEEDQATEQAA